jgi:competence ComEA-like helix-hairpin-helix protein
MHYITAMAWRSLAARSFFSFLILALFLSATAFSATTKKPPLRPININTANAEELQLVPGIGPVTAEKILQMRKSYGPFKSVDDLVAIRGIGKKRLDKMRKYLTVGRVVAPKSVQPQTSPSAKATPPPATEPATSSEPPLTHQPK